MRLTGLLFCLVPSLLAVASVSAQSSVQSGQALRPALSGRGTSEVILSKPAQPGQAAAANEPSYRIRVDYGQPHLRGRTLHTDSLVPYDKPWRTGANAATTLTTEVDLTLGGAALPKGTYVLFTIPGRAGWKLVVQKDADQGGEYKAENDIARVDLRMRQLAAPLESLTMWLIPSPGAARGELRLAWGMTELSADWSVR